MTICELITYLRKYSMTTKVYLAEDKDGCCIKKLNALAKKVLKKKSNGKEFDGLVFFPDDEKISS